MDFDPTHRLAALGFDEKTETWYVQPPESHRLILTRQSLARLVQLYNSIHKGNPLVLAESRNLHRLEEMGVRLARDAGEARRTARLDRDTGSEAGAARAYRPHPLLRFWWLLKALLLPRQGRSLRRSSSSSALSRPARRPSENR